VYESVILTEYEDNLRQHLVADEENVDAFLEYFERTWIGRRLGHTRKKPLYPVSSWNHHNSLLTGTCIIPIFLGQNWFEFIMLNVAA
jgi:hypothetical protein